MYYRNSSAPRNRSRTSPTGMYPRWRIWALLIGCASCAPSLDEQDTQTTTIVSETDQSVTSTVAFEEIFSWDGAPPKNILMISVDTWRKDGFDYFSDDTTGRTPVLSNLVKNSVVLENHQSCSSWTYPSVICVVTGKDLVSVGLIPTSGPEPTVVPKDVTMLASLLSDQGYNTHGVMASSYLCGNNIGESFDELECLSSLPVGQRSATAVKEKAILALDSLEKNDAPWFLHLHMVDPHTPLWLPQSLQGVIDDLPPLDFIEIDLDSALNDTISSFWSGLTEAEQEIMMAHISARYDALIQLVDTEIGNILGAVEDRGALEDTLVVFWADHGESMFEHNRYGHGITLYPQEANVMAMYYSPRLKHAVWEGRTIHQDIVPTILEALNMSVPEDMTGRLLGTRAVEESVIGYLLKPDSFILSASRGSFRMHYDWSVGSKELYNTSIDPDEADNVYNSQHPTVLEIWGELDLIIDEIDELVDIKGPTAPNP
jgi:membrane-anchored protein YejM (alkaline phosphatase superfamily)